jgi:hypothetical protein
MAIASASREWWLIGAVCGVLVAAAGVLWTAIGGVNWRRHWSCSSWFFCFCLTQSFGAWSVRIQAEALPVWCRLSVDAETFLPHPQLHGWRQGMVEMRREVGATIHLDWASLSQRWVRRNMLYLHKITGPSRATPLSNTPMMNILSILTF